MLHGNNEDDEPVNDMFQEPEGFYEDEKQPTFDRFTLRSGDEVNLRLVGHNPLWGHLLWNAGRVIADYIEEFPDVVKGKYVLELGAGAALPSIVAAMNGAAKVVATDYPDADLIENIEYNIKNCSPTLDKEAMTAQGFVWGGPIDSLKAHLPQDDRKDGFHIIILADLLFNHSEHTKLVTSIVESLRQGDDCFALVFFTPYRPWLLDKDLAFFPLAEENGLIVEKLFQKTMDRVLFESDPGDEKLRRTVFAYKIRQTPKS